MLWPRSHAGKVSQESPSKRTCDSFGTDEDKEGIYTSRRRSNVEHIKSDGSEDGDGEK